MTDEPQRPTTSDKEVWKAHWAAQGMWWRTEPEIDDERRWFLSARRAITEDVERGIYPFRDNNGSIELTRADVEWLLATHESKGVRGPLEPDESKGPRDGIDLRGANLKGQDLSHMPLTRLYGGLDIGKLPDSRKFTPFGSARAEAAIHLEGANLALAHLEGAFLPYAYLNRANLSGACLDDATLRWTHLKQAILTNTSLNRAQMLKANLKRVHGFQPHLQGTNLEGASMQGAMIAGANLKGANLIGAHLEGANMHRAHLSGAVLRQAYFDSATQLDDVVLGDGKNMCASLADVRWSDVDLAVVDWRQLRVVGEDIIANQATVKNSDRREIQKASSVRLGEYETAVRAYRQLANVLRNQGLNEYADYYAYRAHKLQRVVLRQKEKYARLLWSWLLELLAGYGYEPIRTLGVYIGMIMGFAWFYFQHAARYHLAHSFVAALVMSVASFHGRGFFPTPNLPLDNPLVVAGAIEAVFGLVIEASFIATFTQRFFAR